MLGGKNVAGPLKSKNKNSMWQPTKFFLIVILSARENVKGIFNCLKIFFTKERERLIWNIFIDSKCSLYNYVFLNLKRQRVAPFQDKKSIYFAFPCVCEMIPNSVSERPAFILSYNLLTVIMKTITTVTVLVTIIVNRFKKI